MIRFDQRNFDVHDAERLFKKVVHPTHGHNSISLVDKDGIPMRAPNSATLSRLHCSYVITPRGVPAKRSTHSYSGQTAKDKMHNLVNNMDTNLQDVTSFASSIQNHGLSSAGSSRPFIPLNLASKKRTFGSGPPRSYQPMAKSAASERSRYSYLTINPDENLLFDGESERWNGSPQGKRLEKEWAALSQCRALKRSSEIVSHRVDRMYFMSGNKLKLQQKYHVEEDELQHLKDLSQARASARSSRCPDKSDDEESTSNDEQDERLEKIERKLSKIERRLSYIEESREEEKNKKKRIYFKESPVDGYYPSKSVSMESGIQEDLTVIVPLMHADKDVMDQPKLDQYDSTVGSPPGNVESSPEHAVGTEENREHDTAQSSLHKIAIRGKIKDPKDQGIRIWDILSHGGKGHTTTETMINLLKEYPDIHEKTKQAWESSRVETATALTLGIPRKERLAKARMKQRQKLKLPPHNDMSPQSCKVCQKDTSIPLADEHFVKPELTSSQRDKNDHLQQMFPRRKIRRIVLPVKMQPVGCDCRQHPYGKGPLLTVKGTQLPLLDRDYLMPN